jgi:hypothetical protein
LDLSNSFHQTLKELHFSTRMKLLVIVTSPSSPMISDNLSEENVLLFGAQKLQDSYEDAKKKQLADKQRSIEEKR